MNTVSQTFNWSRFVATLRKEIVENKRTILFAILGIYAFLSMIMILGNLMVHEEHRLYFMQNNYGPQKVIFFFFSILVCIMPSLAFKNLTTKAGRTSLFTSPSSTLEKFLVNVLIYVVVAFVMLFVCAQLADLTRFAVLSIFKSKDFIVPGPINFTNIFSNDFMSTFFGGGNYSSVMGLSMLLGLTGNIAIYFFGSVLWRRLTLLKTLAGVYTIEMILILIAVPIFLAVDMESFGRWLRGCVENGNFFITLCIINGVLAIIFFALAWRWFKRKDVVSLKWWK